jgi:hypothetical protein
MDGWMDGASREKAGEGKWGQQASLEPYFSWEEDGATPQEPLGFSDGCFSG